jgi:hypothetical protein
MEDVTFVEMVENARSVWRGFAARERRQWSVETMLVELAKQVGDLSRQVLTAEKYYLSDRDRKCGYQGTPEAIGNELADILYCLIGIADHYEINLAAAYQAARADELRDLDAIP